MRKYFRISACSVWSFLFGMQLNIFLVGFLVIIVNVSFVKKSFSDDYPGECTAMISEGIELIIINQENGTKYFWTGFDTPLTFVEHHTGSVTYFNFREYSSYGRRYLKEYYFSSEIDDWVLYRQASTGNYKYDTDSVKLFWSSPEVLPDRCPPCFNEAKALEETCGGVDRYIIDYDTCQGECLLTNLGPLKCEER